MDVKGLKPINLKEQKLKVLVVDDEVFNLEILTEILQEAGYQVETSDNGADALSLLKQSPDAFHTVLLDRMMPEMNGIEVLKTIRQDPFLRYIPVVMQTAKATQRDIQAGLDAGVLYYLTKPFEQETLVAIVDTSISGYLSHHELRANVCVPVAGDALQEGVLTFRTLDEARSMATLLANMCPDPARVVAGLSELLINAVEHGNLGIGYKEKSALYAQGRWLDEIDARLDRAENRNKKVVIDVLISTSEISFVITDEGSGFDSEKYLTINPQRVVNTHGRGIAIARMMSFDRVEYSSVGNQVVAVVLKGD